MRFRLPTLRLDGVPRTKNNTSTRREEKHNKEGVVPNQVVFSLVPAQRYTRHSRVQRIAAFMQSSTRPSNATSTSERSSRNCKSRESTTTHSNRCLSRSSSLEIFILPGHFSQACRAHASMALRLDYGIAS